MRETILRKVLLAAVVALSAGLAIGTSSIGQEAKDKKAKGRLPPYYADIVTETQKTQIYAVQDKYARQIADLQSQLDAVQKQRDTEIESLLNAEQKDRLKRAREDAPRKRKAAEEKKSAENGKAKTAKS